MKITIPNTRAYFIIDMIGAFVTWITMRFVLPQLSEAIGAEVEVLHSFSRIALGYVLYSGLVALTYPFVSIIQRNQSILLSLIAIANLAYCAYTPYALYHDGISLTLLGWAYFIVEASIIALWAWMELRHARSIGSKTE